MAQSTPSPVRFGIDMLLMGSLDALHGPRIGLVTNDAATTGAGSSAPLTPTRSALIQAGVTLKALFSPEHGLGAAAADGAGVEDAIDSLTGLPVHSLYGGRFRPTPEHLAELDLLLFDIPDVGARFYTYIWTLSHVMEACAETGTPLWVLDRPNPLGGELAAAEGPMLDEAHISTFVGRWSMPIRHSLTVGELARFWRQEKDLSLDLTVVTMAGWNRSMHWPDTGNPFVPTSPAMPSYETALLYPGTCLFEGTNLSEGRGTALPFRVVGAPWLDSQAVADAFNSLSLAGVRARAVQFTPVVSKYAGHHCCGVMLHVLNARHLRPVAAGLALLGLIARRHPDEFAWLPYATAANQPGYGHFDRLIGRLSVRDALTEPAPDLLAAIRSWTQTEDWTHRVAPYLLYGG